MATAATMEPAKAVVSVQKPPHLPFLDGLRGLAALYVVLHHFIGKDLKSQPRPIQALFFWTQYGHFAVDVFIVLSGYCLMLPVARSGIGRLRGGAAAYFKRRARRILPPYYAALAVSLLLILILSRGRSSQLATGDILSHLLLVHNLFPRWTITINMAMWSVATEWQIYFVFPSLLLPVWRRYGNLATVVTGLLAGLIPYYLLLPRWDLTGACPWYIGLFALGMAGAALTMSPRNEYAGNVRLLPWAALGSLALYVGAKFVHPHGDTGAGIIEWMKDILGGLFGWCVIVYCAWRARDVDAIEPSRLLRLLQSRPATWLGAFSYSLYLTHCAVQMGLRHFFAWHPLPHCNPATLVAVTGIPLAVLFAYLFYLFAERPFTTAPAPRKRAAAAPVAP